MARLTMLSNTLKLWHKRNDGFTSSETLTVVAVLGAVAYLLLPLIFPGDALSTEEKAEKDLTQISAIIQERERISVINDALDSMTVGNLGVYASYGEVTFKVEIDENAEEVNYCLIGVFDGVTYYADSYTEGINDTPVGFCLPDSDPEAESNTPNEVDTSEEVGEAPASSDNTETDEDGVIRFEE